jgi:hypothetical protein
MTGQSLAPPPIDNAPLVMPNNPVPPAPEMPVLATDTGSIDAQTKMLMDLLGPKDYDAQRGMYEERFSSLIPSRRRLNFYDLASELGAAILSRPQDEGVWTGVGVGFNNFQRRLSQADLEEKNSVMRLR